LGSEFGCPFRDASGLSLLCLLLGVPLVLGALLLLLLSGSSNSGFIITGGSLRGISISISIRGSVLWVDCDEWTAWVY